MEALISGVASFLLFHFMTHPESRFHKKVPSAKFKRIQFVPQFTIEAKNKILHIHHWMLFIPLLFVSQNTGLGLVNNDIIHGFLLGGIAQGLMYKDSLKFLHHAKDFHTKIKTSSYHKFSFLRRIVN